MKVFLNFSELPILGKYIKIRFKNRGTPCYFLRSRGQKIKNITKIEKKRIVFVSILGLIFYGLSRAKTDLQNKFMIRICVSLTF